MYIYIGPFVLDSFSYFFRISCCFSSFFSYFNEFLPGCARSLTWEWLILTLQGEASSTGNGIKDIRLMMLFHLFLFTFWVFCLYPDLEIKFVCWPGETGTEESGQTISSRPHPQHPQRRVGGWNCPFGYSIRTRHQRPRPQGQKPGALCFPSSLSSGHIRLEVDRPIVFSACRTKKRWRWKRRKFKLTTIFFFVLFLLIF